MLSDILRNRGFKIVDLGANVPEASFRDAPTVFDDLRVVGISVSDKSRIPAVTSVVTALRRDCPSLLLLAGGPALPDRDAATSIGADDWASDGVATAELLAAVF
jgi:methanogenic corrinoid protein MtbC1